jgi:hypothetical protein
MHPGLEVQLGADLALEANRLDEEVESGEAALDLDIHGVPSSQPAYAAPFIRLPPFPEKRSSGLRRRAASR